MVRKPPAMKTKCYENVSRILKQYHMKTPWKDTLRKRYKNCLMTTLFKAKKAEISKDCSCRADLIEIKEELKQIKEKLKMTRNKPKASYIICNYILIIYTVQYIL